MALSKEVKTSILVISGILLLIFGYNYLDNTSIFDTSRKFTVAYDNVAGLASSAPVTVQGRKVGNVEAISLPNKEGKVIVTFSVEKEFSFSKESIVEIYSSGFIGGNNLGIITELSSTNIAVNGDRLKGRIQPGMIDGIVDKFAPLEQGLESTLTSLDSLLVNLNDVLDTRTKNNLKASMANLNSTLVSFNGMSKDMKGILNNNKEKLNSTIANLDITSKNFAKLSDSLAKIEVGKMTKEMESMIVKFNAIATKMDNGEGSIGKLLNDEELYNNLTGASGEMEALLKEMKENPKRFVHFSLFGKKAKPYTEESKETQE